MSNNIFSGSGFTLEVRNDNIQLFPNKRPTVESSTYRLAVISDYPTADDVVENYPISGPVGRLLFNTLGRHGVAKAMCYLGYLNNEVGKRPTGAPPPSLLADLKEFAPNCVLTLGPEAFRFFYDLPKAKIADWRGSILTTRLPDLPSTKLIPAWHPREIFRQWDEFPLFMFDVKRAAEESAFPELRLPQRAFDLSPDFDRARLNLLSIEEGRLLSLDIEGGVSGMKCISFAQHPLSAFIVPWNAFTLEQQVELAPLLATVLGNPRIPKVLQNSLYDNFVLSYAYKMPIRGLVHDTMLSGWEIYPELPKKLGVQASIYTKEPFYKGDRTTDDVETFWRYCCRDSAVTLEICERHQELLTGESLAHYRFNVALLDPVLYMEMRGIRYDKEAAAASTKAIQEEMNAMQKIVDDRFGGFLNINSPKQMCNALYTQMGYPPQHPIDPETRREDKTKRTADVDAILELMKRSPDDPFLSAILRWRSLSKLLLAVSTTTDPDGRVRCAYNVVGTETGRFTCYESPTGSGFNLQTVTGELRRLYLADRGMSFFQLDLAGADGWTVAAHCNRLGDETMLLDYSVGIKPAKVIALMYKHGTEVNTWTRERILAETKDISEKGPDGWLYFACKRVQHGTNYGLGKMRMADQILKDSYKKQGRAIYVSPADCVRLQQLYLSRYPGVARWQQWVKGIVKEGTMSCASGHTRRFFGRSDSHTTYMAALAHEPQANTTYATNRALLNLWQDPENNARYLRSDAGQPTLARLPQSVQSYVTSTKRNLIIEPLHQVHDALCGQFPTELAEWCSTKLRAYFANPLSIAGQSIVIPYDGGYGPSWGDCKTPIL